MMSTFNLSAFSFTGEELQIPCLSSMFFVMCALGSLLVNSSAFNLSDEGTLFGLPGSMEGLAI